MTLYSILISLHVIGGVAIFVALGIEAVALVGLRQAHTAASARTWMGLPRALRRVGPIAMLTTLVAGVWMMVQWWGPQPWMQAALLGIAGMAIAGAAVTGRRMRRLGQALATETGPVLSGSFRWLAASTALVVSMGLRIGIGTAILGLMSVKPGMVGSFSILLTGALVGLAVGLQVATSRPAVAVARGA